MFGLGYAAAEDRLFFMDALRNAGRGQLSSFAGGANAAQDRDQWEVAPYTEADLERQTKPPPGFPADLAATIASDADNYIAGINHYITEAKLDPTKLPGEYAAIGRPQGPEPWKRADLVAAASLVGGIFGKGGGNEIAWTEVKHALDARFKKQAREGRVQGLPRRRGPGGADDRLPQRQALHLPGAAEEARRKQPRDLPPRLAAPARDRRRASGARARARRARACSTACSSSRSRPPTRCSSPPASRRAASR